MFDLVFGLPPAIVAATLGQIGVEEVVSLAEKVILLVLRMAPLLKPSGFRSPTMWLSDQWSA